MQAANSIRKDRRIQLTLFANESEAEPIENLRRKFNPIQYALIRCHVTLCREEELQEMAAIIGALEKLKFPELIIRFGPATRFSNGEGVLMPAIGALTGFHQLREEILGPGSIKQHQAQPHITLMHPRNSVCTDELFDQILGLVLPSALKFPRISLIEQEENKPWRVMQEFNFF